MVVEPCLEGHLLVARLRIPAERDEARGRQVSRHTQRSGLELRDGTLYFGQEMHEGEPACLMRANASGAGTPDCLDTGYWRYPAVGADDTSVFFIRDTEIVRLPRR